MIMVMRQGEARGFAMMLDAVFVPGCLAREMGDGMRDQVCFIPTEAIFNVSLSPSLAQYIHNLRCALFSLS